MMISINKPYFLHYQPTHTCKSSDNKYNLCRLVMWEVRFVKWNEFFPLSFLHSCSFLWNVHFYNLSTWFFIKLDVNFLLKATALAVHWVRLCLQQQWCHCVALLLGLCLLLGYPYTQVNIHQYTENTLVQHKMANNSRMALCCQNQKSKGTGQRYGLHSSANSSVHSASVTVLGLLKKKTMKKKNGYKWHFFAIFRLVTWTL